MLRTLALLLLTFSLGCSGEAAEEVTAPAAAAASPAVAPTVEEPPTEPSPAVPEVARPYEEGVDAQAQIDAAVAASEADDKRVLLMFGANWCVWCRRLEHVFRNDPRVSSMLERHFRLVHVDVGARESSTNRAVVARYGDPLAQGLPCLVVLTPEGTVAHVQETGSLEDGDHHDPARVLAFLTRFRPPTDDPANHPLGDYGFDI